MNCTPQSNISFSCQKLWRKFKTGKLLGIIMLLGPWAPQWYPRSKRRHKLAAQRPPQTSSFMGVKMQNKCKWMLIFFWFFLLDLSLHIAKRTRAKNQNSWILVLVWVDHSTSLESVLIYRKKMEKQNLSLFQLLIILYGSRPKCIISTYT